MILMLNCSYKNNKSNSMYFLKLLEKEMGEACGQSFQYVNIRDVFAGSFNDFVSELKMADVLVIGAPLYVDGLPAQAVRLMEQLLEQYNDALSHLKVYVVSNLGFYESSQIRYLLEMVENWCVRMGMTYGGGLAIGAGPMIRILENMSIKKGLNKDIGRGYEKLAACILCGEVMENYYAKTGIPRVVYLKAAHHSFHKTLKANGAKE